MTKILYIDDSQDNLTRFEEKLSSLFDISSESSPEKALDLAKDGRFDLILMDVLMPGKSGLELYHELVNSDWYDGVPVILKSNSRNEEVKLEALSLTKTDFISFGMSYEEIGLRIQNQVGKRAISSRVILGHSLILDIENIQALYEGECLGLTKQEFKILKTLSDKKLKSKRDLVSSVWGESHFVDDNNINTHLVNLRKKIEITSFRVKNIRNKGFILDSLKS
ncbi:hypothetical protein A9Q84_04975 [Halobacteriovorax marinus]|uniref:Uncharacterized protein n=1 Tax=Halobacteriovorax marinus TaxID=97084 RepID=A0A1Y5FB90_9BACT|nr:hypothetical protein A9Q84_04975 [Halobacteriovorax marinus]